jgi:hypothetical protein
MSNQNQHYLQSFLVNQLVDVTMEIHKLSSLATPNELEVWKSNGYYDGIVFRKQWIEIQLEELSKSQNK